MRRRPSHVPAPARMWLDVAITSNAKVDELLQHRQGPKAFVAYIELLGWAVQNLTDGYISSTGIRLCHNTTPALVRVLVDQGLLRAYGEGWSIPDFLEYQQARASWVDVGEKRAKAGKAGNCRRWHDDACRCLEGQPIIRRTNPEPTVASAIASAIASGIQEEEEEQQEDGHLDLDPSLSRRARENNSQKGDG